MKMDRDVNTDGRGKYALILMRKLPSEPKARADVTLAFQILEEAGMLDWGDKDSASEFFVMRLKDKFSYRGLLGYMKGVELEPEPDFEYAKSILDMVGRTGPYSKFCKLPD